MRDETASARFVATNSTGVKVELYGEGASVAAAIENALTRQRAATGDHSWARRSRRDPIGARFLIWISGERENPEVGSAPWWEQPFVIVADNPTDAILAVLHGGLFSGREVDRVTATLLPADYVTPPLGPASEPTP